MFHKHKHRDFVFPIEDHRAICQWDIDETVGILVAMNHQNQRAIAKLQSDLAAFHAHYRSELCGDCCHVHVCGIFPSVKYGFECEDKAHELEVMTFEVEPETGETEPSKEGADERL